MAGVIDRSPSLARRDPRLVQQALDAMVEIAWGASDPEVTANIRRECQALPDDERERMLHGMVDPQVLEALVEQAARGDVPEAAPNALEQLALGDEESELVDRALDPLVALTIGTDAQATVARLRPTERAALLLSAMSGRA